MISKITKLASLCAAIELVCQGQQPLAIPEGTKLKVRLESTLSPASAEEGQTVEMSVAEPGAIDGTTVFAEGARVTGTITEAYGKRRLGRAGKLDFSIDRAKAADDQWVDLRYTVTRRNGQSHSVRTGVITAGVAVFFWPTAPVVLLMKGKDISLPKGMLFEVYTSREPTE